MWVMTTLSCSVTDLAEEKRQSGPSLATSARPFLRKIQKIVGRGGGMALDNAYL
jgi:hypothetical protein